MSVNQTKTKEYINNQIIRTNDKETVGNNERQDSSKTQSSGFVPRKKPYACNSFSIFLEIVFCIIIYVIMVVLVAAIFSLLLRMNIIWYRILNNNMYF